MRSQPRLLSIILVVNLLLFSNAERSYVRPDELEGARMLYAQSRRKSFSFFSPRTIPFQRKLNVVLKKEFDATDPENNKLELRRRMNFKRVVVLSSNYWDEEKEQPHLDAWKIGNNKILKVYVFPNPNVDIERFRYRWFRRKQTLVIGWDVDHLYHALRVGFPAALSNLDFGNLKLRKLK